MSLELKNIKSVLDRFAKNGTISGDAANLIYCDLTIKEYDSKYSVDTESCDIYTDGSYMQDKEAVGWAYSIYAKDGSIIKEDSGVLTSQGDLSLRNVAGELTAVEESLKTIEKLNIKDVVIHHDYTGVNEWAEGNWKTNIERTQNYKQFIDDMTAKDINIDFEKVAAHTGVDKNEKVDQMAKQAILDWSEKQASSDKSDEEEKENEIPF